MTADPTTVRFPTPRSRPSRVIVARPAPTLDCGRYAPKRTVGDVVELSVDVIRDGHEVLRAEALLWAPGARDPIAVAMTHLDPESLGVRWGVEVVVEEPGIWTWDVRAWADPLASWRKELSRKVAAGQPDISSELAEGAAHLAAAARRAPKGDERQQIGAASKAVADTATDQEKRATAALDPELAQLCDRYPDRSRAGHLPAPVRLDVDPVLARFGAWYELFPRSWGGLDGVRRRLPALAELGFDVLYLPPVSPIGLTKRKGRNNALVAAPDDPGSPWAIGDSTGGHDAVHPDLGTVEDFVRLVADARSLGIEVALDFAIQCSADHPWLTEHPEWFAHRPDGTLKFAENPPKKYEDIYNVDFDCKDWKGLWEALRDVVLAWVDRGVRAFRVDNPHTKALPFWEWLIAGVRSTHPDVIFLAEAFTYRALQQELGRIGFAQGYTYFTWKQTAHELREYVEELAGPEREMFRPNFFVNTPDILTEQLQHGGEPTFVSRLVLAATLSPSYGVYSGYEWFEGIAVREGSEEYLDSEKYEARDRSLDGPLLPLMAQLNAIRRRLPALHHLEGITFLDTENDQLLAYAKRVPGGGPDTTVVTVVLLDHQHAQEGVCIVPDQLGLPPTFEVVDELTGERFGWQMGRNYVRLVPGERQAHLFSVVLP